ncbi:hypothetical protein B0I31_12143 [Saccharothrix carnea]|uniref:Uncharacterized protein n=1 Tax=Saccharothrix carnea TaxID=1280637 RepID=A0A2P8HZ20_SACCR|nr:hypothetical protein B0I31_12143 [Saccharothrix carnea]
MPLDVPAERYAAITHAVYSVLDVAGLAAVASVVVDELATDAELNRAFDAHSAYYPWGA